MKKKPPDLFSNYYRQLAEADPEIIREVEKKLREAPLAESAEGVDAELRVETIVLTQGRPVLDVRSGEAVIDLDGVDSEIWKARLGNASALLGPNVPAVGRIELHNHPRGVQWIGTGWLIRDDVIVTNRHVAELFGMRGGDGFVFRPGFDESPMRARVDFVEEFGSTREHEFPLLPILHIEAPSGPDLAFLRVGPVEGQVMPRPVACATTAARQDDDVAVIGYPGRDPYFPDQALMDRIFRSRYDKKRLAPGRVIGVSATRVFHDCSTLGGTSGGEVVSLATGKAVALHFAGTLFERNHAVPIDVVQQRLDDVLSGRIRRSISNASDVEEPASPQAAPATCGRVAEVTIPVRVRVEIGDACASTRPVDRSPTPSPASSSAADADDDFIEVTEARPEAYLDREGYRADFLGERFEVPLPALTANGEDALAFEFDGRARGVLDYHHFSVVMSKSRRVCRFSACNIDGKTLKPTVRPGWQLDPRIPKSAQVIKECYGSPPKFSRGHMTRRQDPAWGTRNGADRGNRDSMHVTNAVPQMQPFNAGVWLDLEDYALQNAREDDMRISVFTGPFLSRNDPVRYGVKIPTAFWKVIAFIHDETGALCATGYTMSQRSFIGDEEFVFGQHENDQRPIAEIERRAGLSFGPLAALDPLRDQPESARTPLTRLEQIRFF
jgi:endonuclease G